MKRRRGGLEAEAGDDHREPGEQEHVAGQSLARDRGGDPLERELPCRAVDEREAEEQHRRAEAADDEVLQARLERADEVDVDRAHDVEADREPLEREEERHQVVRGDEEGHPGAGGREQRVVLGVVAVPARLAVRDADGEEARAGEDQLGERGEPVAADRVGDDSVAVGRVGVEDRRRDEGAGEAERAEEGRERLPGPGRHEHGDEEREARDAEERELRREREPVDVRLRDHGPVSSGA